MCVCVCVGGGGGLMKRAKKRPFDVWPQESAGKACPRSETTCVQSVFAYPWTPMAESWPGLINSGSLLLSPPAPTANRLLGAGLQ